MLKVLVTGANGMLADALCPLLKNRGYLVFPCDIIKKGNIFKLDIRDKREIKDSVKTYKPDIVFHLAAETDVDKCEVNPDYAYQTNAKGTENVAIACKESDVPLVYVSTGAVFDGEKLGGYTEEDVPNPISVYGKTKFDGEKIVRSLFAKYYIVRAGWMIGGYNKDKKFAWKIVQLLKTEKEVSVVIDKMGSPTFTKDFAEGLINIVSAGNYGLYHCVNKGICTRFDIARKIAEYLGKESVVIKPVTSEVFPLPAPRGRSEALLNYNLSRMGIDNMRPWQEALKEYVENFNA